LFSELGREGWTVNVSAAESWTILQPIAMDVDFNVSRSALSLGGQREAIVPQAGLTFTPRPSTTVRGTVSYVAMDREIPIERSPTEPRTQEVRGAGETGYHLRVERRFGKETVLTLDAQSRPFYYDSIGARWETLDTTRATQRLYLSDEAAEVRDV